MVKEGYKLTEIGVIPENWDCVELPEITSNSSTSIKIGPFGSALKKELLTKNGYKVYGQENIFEKDMTIGDRYINQEHFNKLKSCEIKTNDFLISMMGTIGKCYIVPKQFEEGIIDSHLIRVRINENKYNLQLLVYLFGSDVVLKQINQLTVGGIMDGLSSKIIKKLYVPMPPPSEQKAIAQALSDTDELIISLDKLIAKKEAIKQGTMQQLLTGKKRLLGFSGEWEEKRLGKLLYEKPKYGINAPATKLEGALPNYLRITDITDDGYYSKIDRVGVNHTMSDLYQLHEGDIVLARTGASVGKSYLYNENDGKLIYAGFLIKISPIKEQLNPSYLFQYLKTHNYWKWVQVMSMRSGQPGINGNEYSSMLIPVPPEPEQQAIAKVLSDMDDEIEVLRTKLSKTKAIKEAMMSELLTGKTRLKVTNS